MSDNLFAVFFTTGKEKGMKNISNRYTRKKIFQIADNIAIVASDGLSSEIAESVKIGKEADHEITGAVFKLNGAYAGYARGDLWEWLEKVEGA